MKKFSTLLLLAFIFFTASNTYASETNGTIVSGGNSGYAWSNQAGWVNFGATNSNIQITDGAITGHAWNSNYGWINMAPTNGGITIAASGALSGYAWGSSLGWINFSGVSINSSGKFVGQATGTIIGTLTFDCSNCDVRTDYRPQNFRTTSPSTPSTSSGQASSGSSSGRSGGGIIQPAPGLDTTTFPPGIGPDDAGAQAPGADVAEELLPAQLFDIRLLLDRNEIPRIEDLVARVIFESFGRVPTPVEMTFTLLDAEGNEFWTSVDTTTVQTSAVFVKRFTGAPSLTPGSYTARLDTLYNTDPPAGRAGVRDTFEAPFTVLSEEEASSYWILWLTLGIAVIMVTLLFFLWWRRRF